MPTPKEKRSQDPKSKLELTGVSQIQESDVVAAFKLMDQMPEERRAQLQWEDNARPRKRTEEEKKTAREEASLWSNKEFELHRPDLKEDPAVGTISANGSSQISFSKFITHYLNNARFYENIEYFMSAARFYESTAEQIMGSRNNINSNTLKWAKGLLDKAASLLKTHFERGGHDNEFSPLREDIAITNIEIARLQELKAEEIDEINSKIDEHINRYKDTVTNPDRIESIEHSEFRAFLALRYSSPNTLNGVATEFAFAAETAIESGSKAWGRELFDIASDIYGRYLNWQKLEGIIPNTSDRISTSEDPRLHDHMLVHKTLARVEEKLGE